MMPRIDTTRSVVNAERRGDLVTSHASKGWLQYVRDLAMIRHGSIRLVRPVIDC